MIAGTLRATILEGIGMDLAMLARIYDENNDLVAMRRFGFGLGNSSNGRRARARAKAWCIAQGVPEERIIKDADRRIRKRA